MVPSSLTGVVRLRRALGLTLVLGLLAASPARVQDYPQIDALGGAGHSYAVGDVDTVNRFNGNLTVRIPLASYDVGAHLSYDFTLVYNSAGVHKGIWQLTDAFRPKPHPDGNAGAGWRWSLGDLREEVVQSTSSFYFIDSGGAEHRFHDSLHPWADDGLAATDYTRDGSYLRMKLNGTRRDVEHPDGQIFEFSRYSTSPPKWRLVKIHDRFGHSVTLSYNSNVTTISDTLGRSHQVHWSPGDGVLLPDYVNRFDLAGPNGNRANWYLDHTWKDTYGCAGNTGEGSPMPYSMPLLYNVSQPGGLENPWQMGGAGSPAYGSCGDLTELRLPTRGLLRWTWQSWGFPKFAIFPDEPIRWTHGVRERRLLTASGDLVGVWKYFQSQDGANSRTRTVMQPPDGACEVHHFRARPNGGWDYGLPFDPAESNTTAGLKLYLSQEIFPASGASDCTGTKLRSIYVHYEREQNQQTFKHANERLYARRVHYHDDGNRWIQTRFSDFDGLGHFRQVVTSGNLQSGDSRTERTQYNRNGNQTLTVDDNGNPGPGYTHPPAGMTWVLGIFSYQQQQEGNVTAQQNYTFEGATGFLISKRILRTGTSTGNQDVVVDYTRYPNGDPPATRGQLKGERWSIENQSTPDLWLHHNYQHGVLSETEYRKPGSEFSGLFQYRATIDRNSGLPTQTTDTSGVKTNYTYDLLGRLLEAQPGTGGGACLTYSYTKASGNTGPKWGVIRQNENCSGNLGQRASWYDVWGRNTHDRIYMPDNTWTQKRTRYNARGWVTGESAWGSSTWTDFLDFDAFGRPQTIRPPEGAAHDVRYEYAGDRTVHRGVSMNLFGPSSDEMRIRAALEHYDSFGRLVRIDTPANPDGTDVTTWYQYDVGDRLTHVNFGGQERFFIYDNRGFLSQECHPEKEHSSNPEGCVEYSAYDALGNPTWKDEGNRRLTSQYDFAGRVTKLSSNWDATVSQWFYDEGDGFGTGKVHLTRRTQSVNFPNDGIGALDVVVQEKINYTGPAGAPTSHSLTIDLPGNRPTYAFLMGTAYNDAGQRTLKAYPQCVGAACAGGYDPQRHQQYGWTRGFLTQVNGFASSITYHPHGLWKTIVRTNGVTDHQSVWQGQGRPGRIWTTGATTWDGEDADFDTGNYQYDGVGNVKRMGNDDFGHQRSGRLFYAESGCQNSSESSCHRQRYAYDSSGRGNLYWVETRPRGGSPSVVSWTLDVAKNRLSAAIYDVAGNMTQSPHHGALAYDSQNALVRMGLDGDNIPRQYVYTADGERVWTILGGGFQLLYVRDVDGKLLRTYSRGMDPGEWESPWIKMNDPIWRGSQRVASGDTIVGIACPLQLGDCWYIYQEYPAHHSVDHLGTPRLRTNEDGEKSLGLGGIFPFGSPAPDTDTSDIYFTGHERDNLGTASTADDMDYMHARFYTPQFGRFFQVDPYGGNPFEPQSWNRYTYGLNNPLKYTDPTGLVDQSVINVTGEDPCPRAPEGMSCDEWERQQAEERINRIQIQFQLRSSLFHMGGAAISAGERYWAWRTAPQEVLGPGFAMIPLAPGAAVSGLRGAFSSSTARAFGSHSSFVRALGAAGKGRQWHHIVGQTRGNVARFGPEAIHNTRNVVNIDVATHTRISAYYSSKQPFTGGLRVHEWLSTQSYGAQREFGLEIMTRMMTGP